MAVTTNLKLKPLATKIHKVTHGEMEVDTTGDEDLLQEETYSWDELNALKDELGKGVVSFVFQVESVLKNPDVVNNLGTHASDFKQTVDLFFSDINNFSLEVKGNRLLHEHLTGKVTDLSQLNLYNRCAMTYHSMFAELSALVTPTLSKLMLIISEIIDDNAPLAVTEEEGKTNE